MNESLLISNLVEQGRDFIRNARAISNDSCEVRLKCWLCVQAIEVTVKAWLVCNNHVWSESHDVEELCGLAASNGASCEFLYKSCQEINQLDLRPSQDQSILYLHDVELCMETAEQMFRVLIGATPDNYVAPSAVGLYSTT